VADLKSEDIAEDVHVRVTVIYFRSHFEHFNTRIARSKNTEKFTENVEFGRSVKSALRYLVAFRITFWRVPLSWIFFTKFVQHCHFNTGG